MTPTATRIIDRFATNLGPNQSAARRVRRNSAHGVRFRSACPEGLSSVRARRNGIATALAALFLASWPVAAPAAGVPGAMGAGAAATIGHAVQFDLPSAVSGRTYRIYVATPAGPPPARGYPVVYITDGNGLFPIAASAAAILQLGEAPGAIVVGIGYPTDDLGVQVDSRTRDLTPTQPAADMGSSPGAARPKPEDYAGADLFYRFLVEELRPVLANRYTIDPSNQALYGHSLGGLFTLGVLFKHPEAFRTYLVSSPSIWWDNRVVLSDEAGFAARVSRGEISSRLLVMAGAGEKADMVDNARGVAARLSALHGAAGYTAQFNLFEQEDHTSVIPASISRALRFALQ